ncbi:MAG: hypothetical protein EOO74_07580, partial [Myxococcales bacterium]
MKTTLTACLIAALGMGTSACLANPSQEAGAEDLRTELAAMTGVETASLDYTEPVPLDSGKLLLKVRMTPDAPDAAVRAVVTTTYDAFRTTHRSEEGDLDVAIDDDVIHLRSFEPEAGTDAVGSALDDALTVLPTGKVTARINTQDVSRKPHVHTEFQVTTDGSRPSLEAAVQA